jgi:hypothetical protein
MAALGADDDFELTERQNQVRGSGGRFSMTLTALKKILIIRSHRDNSAWKSTTAQAAFEYQLRDRAEGSCR